MTKAKYNHIDYDEKDLDYEYERGKQEALKNSISGKELLSCIKKAREDTIKEFERIIEEIKQEHDEDTMEDYDLSEDERYWVCYSELKQGINRLKAK